MEKQRKPNYTSERDAADFAALRKDVQNVVKALAPQRRTEIYLKAVLFPFMYICTYVLLLTYGNIKWILFATYILLGLLLVIIFLNNIHDAVHKTIFQSNQWNRWYVYLFDLMGANSYVWKLRHVRFHHNYPNVQDWDTDIEQSSLLSVFPNDTPRWYHRYQHIYLPVIYPFYLLNWLLVRDFKDYFNKKKTIWKLIEIPTIEYFKLFFFKLFFLLYLILIPYWVLNWSIWVIISGFLSMIFTASIFSLIVLLSPHANIYADFPVTDESMELPDSWSVHMLKTTNDIIGQNFVTRFLMGNFNYHVAHHLFPNINHAYYPEITVKVMEYAEKYDLPYKRFTLWSSLKNHYKLLKKNGTVDNLFEETM
jgi:linoleoyl-CoA desaturase